MIHVFHGFLGSTIDFNFLKSPELVLHDLYDLDLDNLTVSPEDTIIGYSMGGRIALELALRINFNLKHLVLINAHPGLESSPEKVARRTWERMIEDKMDSEGFISYWNSLPVFAHDLPLPEKTPDELQKAKIIFRRFRLSDQKNFLPELAPYKEKVLWIIGDQDEKYRALADTHLHPQGIRFRMMEGGHRLFQHPEKLRETLKAEGIL